MILIIPFVLTVALIILLKSEIWIKKDLPSGRSFLCVMLDIFHHRWFFPISDGVIRKGYCHKERIDTSDEIDKVLADTVMKQYHYNQADE